MNAPVRTCEVCGSAHFQAFGDKDGHHFTRCASCGLERIDPQPTDEVLAKIYGEHYYDAWGLQTDRSAVEQIKRSTFRRVLRGLGSGSGRLLDCGAATGFLMREARELGYEPFGVELSEFGAKEIASRFGADHAFHGHLEDAPFAPGFFQAITMCDYLEHVRDPRRIVERAFGLLAPGGKLAISMPRVGSLTHRLMGMRWSHYKVEHLYYFSVENLGELLRSVGFGRYRGKMLLKTMSLPYVAHQFDVYPHPVLTPAVHGAMAILPSRVRGTMFPIPMGELVAYAEKRAGGWPSA
jgi:SAM-dependent methyltransferase